jgi:hypothetical protein
VVVREWKKTVKPEIINEHSPGLAELENKTKK